MQPLRDQMLTVGRALNLTESCPCTRQEFLALGRARS